MNVVSNSETLISFCIPVYNIGRNLLEQCIDSIAGQFFSSAEIICCDDCSSDESLSVLNDIKDRSALPVRVLHNEQNSGVSFTRNRCIDYAEGEYLWFVDPDDLLCSGAVRTVLRYIDSKPDAVIGNYTQVPFDYTQQYHPETDTASVDNYPEGRIVKAVGNEWYPSGSDGKKMYGVWGGIFRRSFLNEHGLRFAEGMAFAEDRMFYYEFSQHDPMIIRVDRPVYYYRQRPGSYMHQKLGKRSLTEYESLKMALKIYQSYENTERDLKPEVTSDRIRRHKIACIRLLAMIPDENYVRRELNEMTENGDYPVQMNYQISDVFRDPKKIFDLLIRRKTGFWNIRKALRLLKKI